MNEPKSMNLFDVDNLEAAEELMGLHWQFRAARVLLTAHQLGIFEALREPETAAAVAAKCGTDTAMTEKLLIACCALGLVRRDDDSFVLEQLGRDTLLPESPRYLGGTLNHGESIWWSWTGLPDVVRMGRREAAPKPPEPFASHGHEHFIWAMHGLAANGGGQWLARQLDLSDRTMLLDVGGGPGTYSIALCQRFPNLKAVIWDLPDTIAITEQVILSFGMKDRISWQTGNWDHDQFGQGYDCLLMSNILHGHGSKADMKLAKAAHALEPGGLLIVHDFLLNNDKSGSLEAALFNLMVGAYTVNELLTVIRSVGFTEVSLITGNARRGSGIMTAVRP